jgi:hypothetical protein
MKDFTKIAYSNVDGRRHIAQFILDGSSRRETIGIQLDDLSTHNRNPRESLHGHGAVTELTAGSSPDESALPRSVASVVTATLLILSRCECEAALLA